MTTSAPGRYITGALLAIVAIILLAAGAYTLAGHPAGPASAGVTAPPAPAGAGSSPPPENLSVATPATAATQTVTTVTTPLPVNNKTGADSRTFSYVLRGKTGSIPLTLYAGMYHNQKTLPPLYVCSRYSDDSTPCTTDEYRRYYLKYLDESTQKSELDELVRRIKAQTPARDDQARIAISLVQKIPYDYDTFYSASGNNETRYPYQVLYDNTGICQDKSLLLAYLLRELGYGVVLFRFENEHHMAVGIQCPSQYSYRGSGYAFIETTAPGIVTDAEGNYTSIGALTSEPGIFTISQGESFTNVSEEYADAIEYNQLISMGSVLDQVHYYRWAGLVEKYGMNVATSLNDGLPSSVTPTQPYSATCNIDLARYCSAGMNCCQKNGYCYRPCSQGVWDPRSCVCLAG